MERIVVLGAGFGGLTLAHELDALAASGRAEVTVIDRSDFFQMGFSAQLVFADARSAMEGRRSYSGLRARHVKFVRADVSSIDTGAREVRTPGRAFAYDYLVIALGAELAPELVPGLSEVAYNLCDVSAMAELRGVVSRLSEGTVLILVAAVPFKCPPAPYEYAMILRHEFPGTRMKVVLASPEGQPMPVAGKEVGAQVAEMLKSRGIEYLPGHKVTSIDAKGHVAKFETGKEIPFAALAAMPPHRAPGVVRAAGLTDASGFIPVDVRTLATSIPTVFAVGDVAKLVLPSGMPHPKAGTFAEEQGRAVARTLIAKINGGEPGAYSGKGACYIDVGGGKAAPAIAELLGPAGPRVELSPPSAEGFSSKLAFERERLERWFAPPG
jgi:sulfide:quinone oxidoreductase